MFPKKLKKVILAMSGGVDSSVSAWLLQERGYHVEGLFMKNWEEDDTDVYCSSASDLEDVRSVCEQLKIKLHTINFSFEYWNKVFKIFLEEYRLGRTPNPDILCNKEIKFNIFLNFAIKYLCADYIATGHYVRCISVNNKNYLLRGLDYVRDQSYFLYTVNCKNLHYCLFPVGTFTKLEVREIANNLNFITANKKNSTGICFIGKRNFNNFIGQYISSQPGIILNVDGGLYLGKHRGLIYYTIGQRKGLKIGGIRNGNGLSWYVVDKDLKNNILVVAQGYNHPALLSVGLIANQLYWVNYFDLGRSSFFCTVKTRYHQKDIPCLVKLFSYDKVEVQFKYPVVAVTPGQSAVFYSEEYCLGGGIIDSRIPYIT